MNVRKLSPKAEPAVWIGAIIAVISAIAPRLLHLSDNQWQQALAAAPVIAGLATRFKVSPSRDAVDVVIDALTEAEQDQAIAAKRLADLRAAISPPEAVAPASPPVEAAVAAPPA